MAWQHRENNTNQQPLESIKTHQPCDDCGSRDALTINSDGSTKCFSCGAFHPNSNNYSVSKNVETFQANGFVSGEIVALTKRHISDEVCRKYSYYVGEFNGKPCHIANYKDKQGKVVGQKLRFPDKTFRIIGKVDSFFGSHLFSNGKKLTITEGEIDAMSVASVFENKWPVVSIPNGAASAPNVFKKHIDWLETFDEIVLMFDQDEAGVQAAKTCASILSVGKCKIATFQAKDPNELLQLGRGSEIIQAFWNAQVYRPDGIVLGTDLWETVTKTIDVESQDYPFSGLTRVTRGLRRGEITTFAAGSGVGKSTIVREIAYHLLMKGQKIGYIALEENTRRTALGIIGLHMNKPLYLEKNIDPDCPKLKEAFELTVGSGNYVTYDHWGSIDSDNLINRIRYMHKGLDCGWIFLDHISIVVSGQDGDERKMIDLLMTKLRSLVEETSIGLILVSHLKRPEGRGFEEGRQTTLGHLRGSAGLGQLSDMVIGIERDQQDEDVKNRSTVRVLKNRWSGETGVACFLDYNITTGRLLEDTTFIEDENTSTYTNDTESTASIPASF